MKILFVATVDIHIINHHLRMIHKLHALGHQVDVASHGSFKNDDITNKYDVPFSKNPFSLNNLKAGKQVAKLIEQGGYDIVSCHTPLSSFFTRYCARNCDTKMIYTAHGFHFYEGAPFINRTLYKTMEKIAAKYTDVLVTINEEDYRAARSFKLRKNGEVKLIHGVGIDLEEIEKARKDKTFIREALGIPMDSYICMSIGELNKNKNQLFVLKALLKYFKENPKLHYLICGVGPLKDEIEKWIQRNQLEKQIHLLGYRTDVRTLLYGVDTFFSPSFREGLPVSVMEAMAVGIPVIASNVRGNRDLIHDRQNGLLYEVQDENELQQEFECLYYNPGMRTTLSSEAKEDVKQYGKDIIDQKILELYKVGKHE